jgi:hypothetical protein
MSEPKKVVVRKTNDDDEKYEKLVDEMAFIGVEPRPVPPETLLKALLAQNGHYVAKEIVELMGVADVAPASGYVIVSKNPLGGMLPPGFVCRERGGLFGLFYPDQPSYPPRTEQPWVVDDDAGRDALAADPSIAGPIRAACEIWGKVRSGDGFNPENRRRKYITFPWGVQRRLKPDPVPGLARDFADGRSHAVVLVALGRLGDEAVSVVREARWMFQRTNDVATPAW